MLYSITKFYYVKTCESSLTDAKWEHTANTFRYWGLMPVPFPCPYYVMLCYVILCDVMLCS